MEATVGAEVGGRVAMGAAKGVMGVSRAGRNVPARAAVAVRAAAARAMVAVARATEAAARAAASRAAAARARAAAVSEAKPKSRRGKECKQPKGGSSRRR